MNTKCCDCCYPEIVNSEACGCCEGVEILTPLPTPNRPGLSELAYRIGTHSSFLETMKARLSSSDYPELVGLTTRDDDDPSIAMLDAWATVADVLTFYQERIINEGYLRTATERRSILELARLVGYRLRPGVASSVFLAYTIDENTQEEVTIPVGSRSQSIPGPDELPQTFETSEDLKARAKWNNLKPRMTQPQTIDTLREGTKESAIKGPRIYLKGINTNLKPNDPLLIEFGDSSPSENPRFSRVIDVFPDAVADRTLVTLRLKEKSGFVSESSSTEKILDDVQLIQDLTKRPSKQRRNSLELDRTLDEQFIPKANTGYKVAGAFVPELQETLSVAAGNATATSSSPIKVYALRVKASLFGHNLPLPSCPDDNSSPPVNSDFPDLSCCIPNFLRTTGFPTTFFNSGAVNFSASNDFSLDVTDVEPNNILALDAEYQEIKQGTWVAVDNSTEVNVLNVNQIATTTLGGLVQGDLGFFATCPPITINTSERPGISIGEATKIKSTILVLDSPWRESESNNDILRKSVFYGQSEELELAEEPIEAPVCGGVEDLIELDGFYEGLESGRWVIVSGEREIDGTSGVRFSELAMLSSVTQNVTTADGNSDVEVPRPGEKIHTFIKLANELAFCFKRDTVTIYGNVDKATHGETRQEVLGSGDGSKMLQSFDLKQKPLTYVSASNPTGIDSTLDVFVNDIRWDETDTLANRQATDRIFFTQTDDEDKTSVIFGNGKKGARLPTGIENIKAEYRSGIGKPGNVKVAQISLLKDKPLGVKEVINPLRASGGANREGRDQARKNAPLAIKALDRLVSVQDYEDFSRVYAGIGKARAEELTDGRRQLVHVTIAGADDIPIDTNADLFRNLRQALHDFGDPFQPIELAVRELMLIIISANVRILPDYLWEPVVTEMRIALLKAFSFERRELGQDVLLSEVISVMQAVRGVAYVDVDTLGGIPEKENKVTDGGAVERRLLTPDEIAEKVQELVSASEDTNRPEQSLRVNLAELEDDLIRPAQLAFLTPDVPETLILNRIE